MTRRAPPLSQQAFLRRAKEQLSLEWDALALRAGIAPRALKCYRMPTTSADHRAMPVLAWRAIEALLQQPSAPKDLLTQQELLQAVMSAYKKTLHEVAEMIGVRPLTMDNWMRPNHMASHRGMPSLARAALEQLLSQHVSKRKGSPRKRPPKTA